MSFSIVASAVVAATVGFSSTLAIVVSAAKAVGASDAQTSSWVTALCLVMAGTSAFLSLRHRIPIITAWSTPGAALIAASVGAYRIEEAVGAFVFAATLVLLSALAQPVLRAIGRIPSSVASAMLAGVLVRFVVGVFDAASGAPWLVLPMVATFVGVRLFNPATAIVAVIGVGAALIALVPGAPLPAFELSVSGLVWITPEFAPAALIGLGLPLFLVTMASQNLAGFAVLRASGYQPPAASILATTGLASLISAPFGAHTSNLAAISAAICTGPDAHPDPARRWLTGPIYAFVYLCFAALGASLVGLMAVLPSAFIAAIAGLGLLGAFTGALAAMIGDEQQRFAAVMTFAVTASGFAVAGIGSAFWGLLAGLIVNGLEGWRRNR